MKRRLMQRIEEGFKHNIENLEGERRARQVKIVRRNEIIDEKLDGKAIRGCK